MPPQFSVVIPTWNRADSILRTLQSCFAQSMTDYEIVVIDDGSTDNTLEVLADIDDLRLKVFSQSNAGPAAARNHGMREARGRYIAFLDSDDYWYPEFLQQADCALKQHGDVLLYGRIIVDRGVGRYWLKPERALGDDESIYDYLYVDNAFIQTSTLVIPQSLAQSVQWDEAITFCDNDQFTIDCWHTGIRFHMLPQASTLYTDSMRSDSMGQLPVFAANSKRHTNFFDWMETQKIHMSERAWAGYQARFRSVSLARRAPLHSLKLLWQARQAGVMSGLGILRQCIQNFFPRGYRRLVDQYVRLRGVTLQKAREMR